MFDYLLPNVFKKLGLILFISSFILVLFAGEMGFDAIKRDNTITITALIGFSLLINSKEIIEDERTMLCRYKALGKTCRFLILLFLAMKLITILILQSNTQTSISLFAFLGGLTYLINFEKLIRNKL